MEIKGFIFKSLFTYLMFGVALVAPALAADYAIVNLSDLSGSLYPWARTSLDAINNNGQIVGGSLNSSGVSRAFVYSNGVLSDLGDVPGADSGYSATAISNNGLIVGSYNNGVFIYSNGAMNRLNIASGDIATAAGINASGQVVGTSSSYIGNGQFQNSAFLYENGVTNNLGALGAYSASGINNNGQITGQAVGAAGAEAYLYSNGLLNTLGTLGGTYSNGYAINATGQVVGISALPGDSNARAFLYSNGAMIDLGSILGGASNAQAINDSGDVVGQSFSASAESSHAFLYSNGAMFDLNSLISPNSGWLLTSATGINDLGQIIGVGKYNGKDGAFLILPTPIPGSAWLFGSVLTGLSFARKYKAALKAKAMAAMAA